MISVMLRVYDVQAPELSFRNSTWSIYVERSLPHSRMD